ncbi:MAG: hypothetical protein RJA09_2191 [Pseudomonadota bacterium]
MSGSKSSPRAAHAAEPLTLTVHGLPVPDAGGADRAAVTRAGRWKMLLVLLVCASPVIASYFTYYVIRPEGRRNYGELIDPQRPLPDWQARTSGGEPMPMERLKGQWLLVSVSDQGCGPVCEKHLYWQRQLREGLGKEKDRLDWVWLRLDDQPLPETLREATAAATVLHAPADRVSAWLAPASGQALPDHLYVVDPLGNWMMRFPADADAAKVRRDLERLLRASSFWDKPGRP